jgi:regulator of nucleoside diphosphate kinase
MSTPAARRPPIVLARSDRAILERAALVALLDAPRVAGALLEEVDRAQVVDDDTIGHDVVRLGSIVTYREGKDGPPLTIHLVTSEARCRHHDAVSVLTSTGAALLGLRTGQSIVWPDRVGAESVLTVLATRGPSDCPAGIA